MSAPRLRPVRLEDYRPPAFRTTQVELVFHLDPEATEVEATLFVERQGDGPLVLYGRDLETLEFRIDNRALDPAELRVQGEELTLREVPDRARIFVRTRIRPRTNTTLMGLYESGGLLVTQCEAEGFRRIVWSQDRPDVLARYRVRIEADRSRYPLLLSNGNPLDRGTLEGDRHWALWEDPFPKPSYLFALVAGQLDFIESRYTTRSGREVTLRLYAEPRFVERCRHALRALELAMRWDEETYGLECDLDLYQIVAVADFNFGAMENKGLNIFNASALLASPETATDADYLRITRIVAHEYFHNWTGNRVTLRDWFQLTLKEGLTVLRDQQFMADWHSPGVTRIGDVRLLREAQFPEDAGPLAHPVRPKEYVEINNFYTTTVYYKGAEILRMLEVLLGRATFVRGVRHYLARMDGRAATVEDLLASMAAVSGRDLSDFARWYDQVGTPVIEARWSREAGGLRLELRQRRPDHDSGRDPLVVPVAAALLDAEGRSAQERVIVLDRHEQIEHISCPEEIRLPSLLRGFSAPVRLEAPYAPADLAFLLAHDSDPFNRWEAGQRLALLAMEEAMAEDAPDLARTALYGAFATLLATLPEDAAFTARLLELPSRGQLVARHAPAVVEAVDAAWRSVRGELALRSCAGFCRLYDGIAPERPYRPEVRAIGARSLRNMALSWLALGSPEEATPRIERQYELADNLTEWMGALAAACAANLAVAEPLLERFYERNREEPLVIDKWFALQASREDAEAVARVRALLDHRDFGWNNPNRVRALLGAFAHANFTGFHRADGAGYRLIADAVCEADGINPQLAARLVQPLCHWARYAEPRAGLMRAELARILERPGLSRDVAELAERALKAA